MKNLKEKIFDSVQNGKLKIVEGKRKWYNYIISIQELCIFRNNKNGFIIDVYDLEESYLERVKIEIKTVCEFGCVHNKIFLES